MICKFRSWGTPHCTVARRYYLSFPLDTRSFFLEGTRPVKKEEKGKKAVCKLSLSLSSRLVLFP